MEKKILTYRVLLNEEPEGGFTVTVPALPGCITYGENLERGFILKRVNGSHHIFYHAGLKKMTVVPVHKKDLPIGTLMQFLNKPELTKRIFESIGILV